MCPELTFEDMKILTEPRFSCLLTQTTDRTCNSVVSGHPVCIVDSGTTKMSTGKKLLVIITCSHNGSNHKTCNMELHWSNVQRVICQ